MFYLEKQLSRSSFHHFYQESNYALVYQYFHLQPNEWNGMKTKIRTISPTCQWKLSAKHQIEEYDGPLFYIVDTSWESLQSVYTALQSMHQLSCLGGKYEGKWVSLSEMEVIQKSDRFSTLPLLTQTQSNLSTAMMSPATELCYVLTCSLSDLNR